MTTLTLELSPKVYRRLREQADRLGKTPQLIAEELLAERLTPQPLASGNSREKVRDILRAAGLLSELSPALRARADATVRLADVEASLRRRDGAPLSEIVLEQRGPGQ